ncbi:MAG: dihydrodipicolinate synthase family protein [Armatimonadota bacterium]
MSKQRAAERVRGVIAPMFTPFTAAGELDLNGAANLARYLADTGYVDGVFVRSGLGQMYTFTTSEVLDLAKAALDAVEARLPILVGCAGEWNGDLERRPDPKRYLGESIRLCSAALEMGAAAAVLVVPFGLLPSTGSSPQETVLEYYREVASAVSIPLVIYQPPGTPPEYRISPELMKELLKLHNIVGMKLSVSTAEEFAPISEVVKGAPFSLIAGAENFLLGALKLGAVGVIGQGCNTYPEILQAVIRYYRAGDIKRAEEAQQAVLRALRATDGLDTGVVSKQILIKRGVAMHPYGRNRPSPYPDEIVSKAAQEIDRCAAPYRR